jgi:hypothetical protein
MRESNEDLIELLSATHPSPDSYGCIAQMLLANEHVKVLFGISQKDYVFLKKILSTQPFQPAYTSKYRYFFVLSWRKNPDTGNTSVAVRIEQGTLHKQFFFDISKALLSNLAWLKQLKSLDEIAHIRLTD